MGKITSYFHHGYCVYVDEKLKGKHKKYCLCYRCANFFPDNPNENCKIANLNFANCQLNGLVLPVWECPEFMEL